jgi:exosortase/archaeosortase family protein
LKNINLDEKKVKRISLYDYKEILFFVGKAVILYLLFTFLFNAYVGIIDPKGLYYSSQLAEFSLIDLILKLIIYPVKWVLELVGYQVRYTNNTVGILHSNGIVIAFPCLGINLMIVAIALGLSFPKTSVRKKIKFIVINIIGIHLINVCRMLTIIIVNHIYPEMKNKTHDYFNLIGWFFILLMFYWFIKNSGLTEEKSAKHKHHSST